MLTKNGELRRRSFILPNMQNSAMVLVLIMNLTPIVIGTVDIGVGVILDMESSVGKTSRSCISMALDDFYQTHNHTTKIRLHFRNSNYDNVEAASAAIELLENVQVMAIIGPHTSAQADFVIDIGSKSKVPILSMAMSPHLSPKENPYFVRVSQNSSSQAQPIAAVIKSFSWREVVFIYEDGDYGRGLIPYLSDAMLKIGAQVKNRSVLSHVASDDRISEELYKLKTMQTRVFVVHLLPNLASRFFKKANEIGMLQKGYAWIITDVLTSLLHTLDPTDIDSMQGVLGIKPYIPRSNELKAFEKRWKRRFRRENPRTDKIELDMFGIWSYDTTYALAMALEKVGSDITTTFQRQKKPITDLDAIGTSKLGSRLLSEIRKIRLKGLSGDFFIVDGQLQSSNYQIVNIIKKEEKTVGFWTQSNGISNKLISQSQGYKNGLGVIKWPGDSNDTPKGWEIPKLRVGFPEKGGFDEYIKTGTDPKTNKVKPTGFCVDVFEAVMKEVKKAVPDAPPYEYVSFNINDSEASRSYDDLVYQIVLKKFDVVIGDVTILANRSKYVDFTLPYTESGVSMITPTKVDERKNAWIFMRPLEINLWITTFAFFIYTGVVVWVLEHRVNKEFRGRPYKQVGMIFWFSFSTLVFAHKEKMISNLSRFVVIVWIFVVLVLTSSYTASLTSMLTVQQLQPAFTDIHDLMRQGDYVGYKDGSFVANMLKDMGFDSTKLNTYNNLQEYDDALSKGSKNGGVSAIVDELPYIKLFMAKYHTKYIMVGPTYKTAGFGFAFPKGSPLVPIVSKAVLNVTETKLGNISYQWLGKEANFLEQNGAVVTSGRLSLDSFKGLFLIAGVSSTSALIVFMFRFFYENRGMLLSDDSIRQKLSTIVRTFDEEKDQKSYEESKKTSALGEGPDTITAATDDLPVNEDDITNSPPSPTNSINHQAEVFSHDEGLSPTEPGTPIHDMIDIVETTINKEIR